MAQSLENILVKVWRQVLIQSAKTVEINLNGDSCPVKSTKSRGLKQIDFGFGERDLRGLEQNPDTKSRWAAMARDGKKVMQFLENGRYVAVVVDGKGHMYRGSCKPKSGGSRKVKI